MAQQMVETQIIDGEITETFISGSCPDLTTSDTTSSDGNLTPESRNDSEEDNIRMQRSFEGFINESLEIPDQYQEVTVKVISWCKELDDLKCEVEVRILNQVSN